jgi:hypothetical protein
MRSTVTIDPLSLTRTFFITKRIVPGTRLGMLLAPTRTTDVLNSGGPSQSSPFRYSIGVIFLSTAENLGHGGNEASASVTTVCLSGMVTTVSSQENINKL